MQALAYVMCMRNLVADENPKMHNSESEIYKQAPPKIASTIILYWLDNDVIQPIVKAV